MTGYDEKGKIIAKLVLTNARELSEFINKAEAVKLIKKIDAKDSDMTTMMSNGTKYLFPNTG